MTALLAQAAAGAAEAAATTGGAAEFWVFWVLGPLALGAAIAMVVLRNPVHAALMLVLNFFALAVFYAVLEAQFLAAVQVIVYAGAIMVLFLFVLMLLGVDRDAELGRGRIRGQRPAAVLLGLVLLACLAAGVGSAFLGDDAVCGASASVCAGLAEVNAAEGGNVKGVGDLLFTRYVWPFEVMSVLLVIAALGAMVLGRRVEDPADLIDVERPEPRRARLPATTGRTEASRVELTKKTGER